jgi:hypothetical protein
MRSQGLDRLGTHARASSGVVAPAWRGVTGSAAAGRRALFAGSESTGGNGAARPASGLWLWARLGLGPNQNGEKKSLFLIIKIRYRIQIHLNSIQI